MKYTIKTTKYFDKKIKSYKNDKKLLEKIKSCILALSSDPFENSLKTHKVISKLTNTVKYSSRIDYSLRIIWDFDTENQLLYLHLLDIGGHDGGRGVY